ncbi:hypothetical protein C8R42DRAFT_722560 [Lentinula raphanica]|nr:hypothetical protein C8R42DRAFT_722560 [Lentinula raphanica]
MPSTTTTTNLRSPSPALPGAWPHTPLRSRSLTRPTPTSADSMQHLDINRVQRKVTASSFIPGQPTSLSSDETLAPSATSRSIRSEDSRLTTFAQNASIATSTSTLQEREHSISGYHKVPSSSSEPRIHQLPSPETSPDTSNTYNRRVKSIHSQQQIAIEDPMVGDVSIISQSSRISSSPNSSNFTPNQSSISGSPMSPMIFVSPTASNRTPPAIRRIRAASNQSYSFSSDEDGEYDDSGLLRLGSPSSRSASLSSSPGSSLLPSPNRARRRGVSRSSVSPISESHDSSTEGLQVGSQLHLTSLSLPESVNMDDSVLDAFQLPDGSVNEDTQQVPDWTLSLTGLSGIPAPESSPRITRATSPIPAVTQYSISPSPSLRARLENPLATRIVDFPSPALSGSPAVGTSSPLSLEEERALEINAAEYATAVMMSSWGSTGLEIGRIGLELPRMTNGPIRDEHEQGDEGRMQEQRTIITSSAYSQKRGVISKVKRFGNRVKHILQGKSKKRLEIEVSNSRKTTNTRNVLAAIPAAIDSDFIDNYREQSTPAQATPPTVDVELSTFNIEDHVRVPYPVSASGQPVNSPPEARPGITTDTYSASPADRITTLTDIAPNINVSSLSLSPFPTQEQESPTDHGSASPPTHSEEIQQQIEAHARPKTIEEIKNRHRLSLSAISNHLARPSSPADNSSPGPSAQIAIRQHRPRPASALILPSMSNPQMPPSPSQARHRTPTHLDRNSISQPIGPVYHYSSGTYPLPPGLDMHTSPRTRTVRLLVPDSAPSGSNSRAHVRGSMNDIGAENRHSVHVPRRVRTPDEQEVNRNERDRNQNRFSLTNSLTTLSNFAAGLVEHGSWARFDTKRGGSA